MPRFLHTLCIFLSERNADISIAGTPRILIMTTFISDSICMSINLSAAAKNIGPITSYTKVLSGTFFRLILSGSLFSSISSPIYFQLLTSVTSAILLRKRSAAITIPTSIATTRSKTTVSNIVVSNTNISDFGECLTRLTISLQPLILYATINRIAAIAGIGIHAAYGISTTSTIRSVTA